MRNLWIAVTCGVVLAGLDAGAGIGPESDANGLYWDDAFALPGANGTIHAVARDAVGNVYVGGFLTAVDDTPASFVAKWDGTSWSPLGTGLGANVYALVVDGAGNLYAGGYFTTAGGVGANRVAKWDGTSWSALGSGLNGYVRALAVDGAGNLYAGGYFTTAGGVEANRVAKWDGTSWSALGTGTDNTVCSLAPDGMGNLYVGGIFTAAGGVAASYVAKWNGTSWSALGTGMNGTVSALVADGSGNLYAGGSFTTAGGVTVNCAAKWNGASWSALGAGMGGCSAAQVNALLLDGLGNVYAGGQFIEAGGATVNHVAKWDGALWSAFGDGTSSAVEALLLDDSGDLYVGGQFWWASGVSAHHVARWDGASWSALAVGTDHAILAVAADGLGALYAGGMFMMAGGVPASRVARWDGASWSALGGGFNATVNALASDGLGALYAGGDFSTADGTPANRVALWDGTSWSALGSGMNDPVQALVLDGAGNVYAGGKFTTAGGAPANYVAKWDGASWSPLGSGTNSRVNALTLDESGNLYVGGEFWTAGGVPAVRVAMWTPATSTWVGLGDSIGGAVLAVAWDGAGNLYAGGDFTSVAGVTGTSRIAKWDGSAWSALGTGLNYGVRALVADGSGGIYAGGQFTAANGAPAHCMAKWDGTAWSTLGTGVDSTVQALALDRNTLLAGGQFTVAGGKPSSRFAVWQPRVNRSTASLSGSPGTVTLGNDTYGFYKPALETASGTTVTYGGGLPVTVTLERADEIQMGGIRVNGAFTLGPEGVAFGGDGATLRVEFSEDDAAAHGAPYTDFVAVRMTYPADYPLSNEAASCAPLGATAPAPIRVENGKQIYAITVPLTVIGSTYGAAPKYIAYAPSNPGATDVGLDTITWTWWDNSPEETGFKVYDDPGAAPPVTERATPDPDIEEWQHDGLGANTQHAFQACATHPYGDTAKTAVFTAWTLIEPVAGLTFSDVTAMAITAVSTNTPSNLSSGASGLQIENLTASQASGWQPANWLWISFGLTPNTVYEFTGQSRNGAAVASTAFTDSKCTLAWTPSPGDNVVCDQSPGTMCPAGTTFTFSNPAGFGAGTHGGSLYRASAFKYAWDTDAGHSFTGGEPDWSAGTLEQSPTVSGAYYLHLQSINEEGVPNPATLDYGPFEIDAESPTVSSVTVLTDHSIEVAFSEAVLGGGLPFNYSVSGPGVGTLGEHPTNVVGSGPYTLSWTPGEMLDGATVTVTVTGIQDGGGSTIGMPNYGEDAGIGTPPTGGLSIDGYAPYTTTPDVDLNVWGDDGGGSGLAEMRFKEDDGDWTDWEPVSGNRTYSLANGDGLRTVHLELRDAAGNVNVVPVLASITLDTQAPTVDITVDTPSTADFVEFTVSFNEPVAPTFDDDDVLVTGTLAGTAVVSGTDPDYTVTVSLTDRDADGTVGIEIGTDVTDLAGNPFAGGVSPWCDIHNWHGLTTEPSDVDLYVNDAHTFAVAGDFGPIVPSYQWRGNNAAKASVTGPTTATWALTDLDAADAGEYWCEVAYDGEMHESAHATLDVAAHLAITSQPTGAQLDPGDGHEFTVGTTGGYPPLTYQWKHDGGEIDGATFASLIIASAGPGDTGAYTVVVRDAHTDVRESEPAQLNVSSGVPVLDTMSLALLGAIMMLVAVLVAASSPRRNRE